MVGSTGSWGFGTYSLSDGFFIYDYTDEEYRLFANGDGDVGIGTTTPQNTLNVIGDGNFTGTIYVNEQEVLTSYTEIDPYWSGNSTLVPYLASANTFTNNNMFNGNLSAGSGALFVNNNTGRVGIGTSSPAAKLDVSGNISSNDYIYSNYGFAMGTNYANPEFRFYESGTEMGRMRWDGTNNLIGFRVGTSGADEVVIDTSGFVGIGTTTPQNTLNVIGDGNFTGTIYQNEFQVLDTRYSHLSNFTDDILWTNTFNATGDTRWLTSGDITDKVSWTDLWTQVYNETEVNAINTSMENFVLNTNTTMKNYVDTRGYLTDESDPLWSGNWTNVAFTNIDEVFDEDLNITGNVTIGSGTSNLEIYYSGTTNIFDTFTNNAEFTDNLTADYLFGTEDVCIEGGNCLSDAGTGDITAVTTSSTPYLSGGSSSGTVNLDFDDSLLNATIDARDSDTTYTAGDALTLTGTDFDFDGGASPGGELGGTWASPTVDSGIHDDEYIELGDSFGGEVSGTYNNLVIGNDVLDDQYYDSEADLTALLNDNYVDVSGDTMTGDLTLSSGNEDRFIDFDYTSGGYGWRLGYLGSGSGDANYFTIQSEDTSEGSFTDVLYMGLTSYDAWFNSDIFAGGFVNATTDVCISGGNCLSGASGDVTDVLGGTAITVTNSGGPQPSVAVTDDSIGDTQLTYNTGQHLTTTSAPTFATIDTGYGANELYDMNQHVLTSSAVTFATVNTGSGAKELGDASIVNGDTNSIPTSDQVYDFVTGLGYITDDTSVPKDDLANSGTLSFDWVDSEIANTLTIDTSSTVAGDAIIDGTIDQSEIQNDILDFVDFQDTLDLDATTEINLGGYNFNIDLSNTGDFQIMDAGSVHHIFYDNGDVRLGNSNEIYVDTSSGKVGIGDSSPSYELEVSGSGLFSSNVTASAFYYSSDERLKTNVVPINNSLERIKQLEGINFNWINSGEYSMGLIAQDVEKVFPEIVGGRGEDMRTIQYANLIAPAIEAIKELDAKDKTYEQAIAELRNETELIKNQTQNNSNYDKEIEELRKEIELLKEQIASLSGDLSTNLTISSESENLEKDREEVLIQNKNIFSKYFYTLLNNVF